jgi:hypothetical protein
MIPVNQPKENFTEGHDLGTVHRWQNANLTFTSSSANFLIGTPDVETIILFGDLDLLMK